MTDRGGGRGDGGGGRGRRKRGRPTNLERLQREADSEAQASRQAALGASGEAHAEPAPVAIAVPEEARPLDFTPLALQRLEKQAPAEPPRRVAVHPMAEAVARYAAWDKQNEGATDPDVRKECVELVSTTHRTASTTTATARGERFPGGRKQARRVETHFAAAVDLAERQQQVDAQAGLRVRTHNYVMPPLV